MRIALLNEFSQASKNPIILNALKEVADKQGYEVFNAGMHKPLLDEDVSEAYTDDNPRLTYLHLGIQAAILLNSKAVDFVITGCGTGQGALMSLNSFPGVFCGYCIEPTDAYLYLQINDGNALSIPYAKGFGWGAELNLKTIFEKAFTSPSGQGYPTTSKKSQNRNVKLLSEMRSHTTLPLIDGLKNIDSEMIKECLTPQFLECFDSGCTDDNIRSFIEHYRK